MSLASRHETARESPGAARRIIEFSSGGTFQVLASPTFQKDFAIGQQCQWQHNPVTRIMSADETPRIRPIASRWIVNLGAPCNPSGDQHPAIREQDCSVAKAGGIEAASDT